MQFSHNEPIGEKSLELIINELLHYLHEQFIEPNSTMITKIFNIITELDVALSVIEAFPLTTHYVFWRCL